MTVQVLLDETPFGVRGAVLQDETPVKLLHFFHDDPAPRTGELYWAKIGRRDSRLGSVVCDLGEGREGLLPVKDRSYTEGQSVPVAIRREGIGDKRPLLTDRPLLKLPAATLALEEGAEVRPGPLGRLEVPTALVPSITQPPSSAGRIDRVPPIVRLLTSLAASSVEEIVANSGTLLASLQGLVPDGLTLAVSDQIPMVLNAIEDDAMARVLALEGGGALIIDEAEALTAIDLDLGASTGQSKKGADSALLRRALQSLGPALSLRGIGGQVVIDLPRGAVRAPKMIREQLTAVLKPFGLMSVPAVTKEGLVVLIFGQERMPIRAHLTEDVSGAFIVPPRAYRAPVVAQRAYAGLREMLQTKPSKTFCLRLRPDAFAVWTASQANVVLRDTFTERFVIEQSNTEDFTIEVSS
ncbi:MAG: ribonuclease E/G [Pseudomonadota bacterium]